MKSDLKANIYMYFFNFNFFLKFNLFRSKFSVGFQENFKFLYLGPEFSLWLSFWLSQTGSRRLNLYKKYGLCNIPIALVINISEIKGCNLHRNLTRIISGKESWESMRLAFHFMSFCMASVFDQVTVLFFKKKKKCVYFRVVLGLCKSY